MLRNPPERKALKRYVQFQTTDMIQKHTKNLILFLLLVLSGCDMISAGHGSLNGYYFETTKQKLENAVMKVIAENKDIYREVPTSQEYKDIYKEITKERNKETPHIQVDTNYVDYYNDGKNYVTIKLRDEAYKFTFRYYGDLDEWKTSPHSEFFIVYAYENGNGGGYKDRLDAELLKRLNKVFELEFVDKVAKELGIKYSVTE